MLTRSGLIGFCLFAAGEHANAPEVAFADLFDVRQSVSSGESDGRACYAWLCRCGDVVDIGLDELLQVCGCHKHSSDLCVCGTCVSVCVFCVGL